MSKNYTGIEGKEPLLDAQGNPIPVDAFENEPSSKISNKIKKSEEEINADMLRFGFLEHVDFKE